MSTLKVNALQDTSGNGYYPARAWINFNGTGTVAIRDDGNVSSIADNGTGDYTCNFNASFASSNYAVSLGGNNNLDTNSNRLQVYLTLSSYMLTSSNRFLPKSSRGGGSLDNQDHSVITLTWAL